MQKRTNTKHNHHLKFSTKVLGTVEYSSYPEKYNKKCIEGKFVYKRPKYGFTALPHRDNPKEIFFIGTTNKSITKIEAGMDDGGDTGRAVTPPVHDDDVTEPDDGGAAAGVGQPVQCVVVVNRA